MQRPPSPMRGYRAKKDAVRVSVLASYSILVRVLLRRDRRTQGFLSSGTYGRVYKAKVRAREGASNEGVGEVVAIKKFKPDKEGEVVTYTGISQSACREIMLNRELRHENLTALREVILEDKSIYMIFEYCEHDFLQIIHHHSQTRTQLTVPILKTLLWQLCNGIAYLHDNWVLHRDLKPANILVNSSGIVKIGDLGLARIYAAPLQPLYTSDKVVVTIWYRAPDLLLGARHYTASVDIWSFGCIFGELLGLRPMFKGEEAKVENTMAAGSKKNGGVPFQRDQLTKIFEVLGTPTVSRWPGVKQMPEFETLKKFQGYGNDLFKWWQARAPRGATPTGHDLLANLLSYDPQKRFTAHQALTHKWWSEEPVLDKNAFPPGQYPTRRSDPKLNAALAAQQQQQQPQRAKAVPAASLQGRPAKRSRVD